MAKRKNPAAVAMGRLGGKAAAGKGGRKYMATLTPEQRREKARRAIAVRWRRATPAERRKQGRLMLAARRAKKGK